MLYGSGGEKIEFNYANDEGQPLRAEARVRRHHPEHGAALPETESNAVREELAKYLSSRSRAGVRRHAAERARRATCSSAGRAAAEIAGASRRATRSSSSSALKLDGLARRDRGQDRQGDPRAAAVSSRRRARIPDAGPQRRHAVRRRGAAHPAGEPDRLGARRRDVHSRRALDRPASARQRAAARHADQPARPRQHGARGRARRRSDPCAPTTSSISGPGAGVHGGEVVAQGTPDGDLRESSVADRAVSVRASARFRCPAGAPRRWIRELVLAIEGARGNNLKNVDRRDSRSAS